jgi:galactokinase
MSGNTVAGNAAAGKTLTGTPRTDDVDWVQPGDDAQLIAGVIAEFRSRYGTEPDGVWSAPGRVNLIGEHIDYNGGTALPFAIPERTWVAAARRHDRLLRGVSRQEGLGDVEIPLDGIQPGLADRLPPESSWFTYVAGVPWALGGGPAGMRGADYAIDSTVPIGAGLSSSAALSCAVALACDDLAASPWTRLSATDAGRARLAQACMRSENEIVGASTGGLDQAAALRSQQDAVLICDFRDGSARTLDLGLDRAGLAILVIDTQTTHQLNDGQYAARRQVCDDAARQWQVATLRDAVDGTVTPEAAAEALERWQRLSGDGDGSVSVRRLRHVFTEMARVQQVIDTFDGGAERPDRWIRLGGLLDDSHASLRDDYQVSCAELDAAVEAADAAGALGARMVGGGFGGSAIALLREEDAEVIAAAVAERFARDGFAAPRFLRVVPSAPGRRDR